MLTPREKSPLPENVPRGVSNPRHFGSEPKHYQLSYSGPLLYTSISEHFVLSVMFPKTTFNNNNNNNNNNRIQRRNSRFFAISSLRCEPSPTHTLKWPGCSRVQITCHISSTYHVQHVVLLVTWYKGTAQLLSFSEVKLHLFELYFIVSLLNSLCPILHHTTLAL